MGGFPPENLWKLHKNLSKCRNFVQNAEISVFFLLKLPIDSRQSDRPTMVDYAGIFIKSTVRINKFRFAVLCKLHKKSRKPTSSTHPHMLHILSPAASASADRNSRQRDHMQIFPAQVRLFSPYANFPNCNLPAGNLTKIKKYVIM